MDTPSIKTTYYAVIYTQKDIVVKMSAEDVIVINQDDRKISIFKMEKVVPTYLIAIAAGNLAYKRIGPRTGVITEPGFLD